MQHLASDYYYNWDSCISTDPDWIKNREYDKDFIVTDLETGKKIVDIISCDLNNSRVVRLLRNDKGELYANDGDYKAASIIEFIQFKIEFPNRKPPECYISKINERSH